MKVRLISSDSTTDLTQGTDYNVSDRVVTLTNPTSLKIQIYRETTTKPLVNWEDASVLHSKDMSLNDRQILHIQEEYNDHLNEELGTGKSFADQAKEAAEEAKNYKDIAIAGQLQADWNEEDTEAKSFIKGKPTELLQRIQFIPYITPKLFGAYGDGMHDDTNSIQICINKAKEEKYAVFIPAGQYKITEAISVPRGLCVYGANEQWPSKENNNEDYQTGTCLLLSENGTIECNSYNEISHLTIYGTGAETGLTMEDRCYIHDLSLMYLSIGISNTTKSSNLSRFERLTITNIDTAISLQANNSKNSQSLTFKDIDIRACKYGLVSNQPSNKFYNFCVQVGRSGGCAIHFLEGACNNAFFGSYFENANYEYEIVCDKGAAYNQFLGGRVLTYRTQMLDNDGTNLIVCKSTQYASSNFVSGNVMFDGLAIAGSNNNNNPTWVARFTSDDNKITLGIHGTSANKQLLLDNSIAFNCNTAIDGLYGRTSMPSTVVWQEKSVSIAAKATLTKHTTVNTKKITCVFANCISHPQLHCNVAIDASDNSLWINIYNTGENIVDQTIKVALVTFFNPADA